MIDTAALREKVLDLAIRGKLVPQDTNDEPASVLLERIHEQKLQMVREGKLKVKDVKDDTIIFKGDDNCYYEKYSDGSVKNIQDEIPFDLPEGWAWSRLKSIVIKEIKRGKAPIYADKSSVLVFAQKCNVKHCGINMQLAKYLNEAVLKKYTAEDFLFIDDVIINSTGTGTLGRVGILSKECFYPVAKIVPDTHITVVRTHKEIVSSYIFFMLKHMQPKLEISGEGSTNQKELRPDYIKNLLCPIPPIGEQLKIVDVITESNEALKVIDTKEFEISDAIASLKSKILELAIQGKLVPQDENDEPATVLLERIRAERKAKLGKKYVESFIYKGDDNCYYEKVGSETKNITDEIQFDIPDSWEWIRLGNYCDKITDQVASGSFAALKENVPSRKEPDYAIMVKTADFSNNFKKELTYTTKHGYEFLSNSNLFGGELILSNVGSVGKVFIVPKLDAKMTLAPNSIMIRCFADYQKDYLYSYFLSPQGQNSLVKISRGATILKFNKTDLKTIIVPIPSIQEQLRIIQEIHKLNSLINTLKDEV